MWAAFVLCHSCFARLVTQTCCEVLPLIQASPASLGCVPGSQFLPRKFKIAVTVPGDNSVDIFTNDIGVVVITDPASGELLGYNLLVGGGMGRTHR